MVPLLLIYAAVTAPTACTWALLFNPPTVAVLLALSVDVLTSALLTILAAVTVPAACIAPLLVMLEPTMLLLAITKLSWLASATDKLPPMLTLPCMPAPPPMSSAPVVVDVDAVVLLMVKLPTTTGPLK